MIRPLTSGLAFVLVSSSLTAVFAGAASQEMEPELPGTPLHDAGPHQIVHAEDLLPAGGEYDPAVPTPAQVLGSEIGRWHVRHDQLVRYFEVLADHSPRMVLEDIGRTHEHRRLFHATVTSPNNHERLDSLREDHVRSAVEGAHARPPAERPVVVWMGYSVHGNESSAANAALLFAYHLCASNNAETLQWLEQSVVVIDPCLNPDGLARFALWANMHQGKQRVAMSAHREHREVWPGGRTNHYWFDLNRDWLLLVHPESRARAEQFHGWRPNLLTDYHEMGTGSSYFFQPGIPSRQNPWTPAKNLDLTRRVARFHADELDAIGSAYYTEESFDDFYYGKGSTYPDVHGAVGILFEQASSRGHFAENSYGPLSFEFTIRNQLRTSLSSVRAAVQLREELLEYQVSFAREAQQMGEDDERCAFVFGDRRDPRRVEMLLDLLLRHRIRVHALADRLEVDGAVFLPGFAYAVPLAQPQYRLVQSLFEERTEFADHAFYDVSSWNLAHSFGVERVELADSQRAAIGERVEVVTWTEGAFEDAEDPYAWALSWDSSGAPRALARLLDAGVRVRVATRPFEVTLGETSRAFQRGTLVVIRGTQRAPFADWRDLLVQAARDDGVEVTALPTGLTTGGIDLGSPSVVAVPPVRPALIVGEGVSAYESGELWHQLDARWGLPVALVESDDLSRLPWHELTHLLLVSGSTSAFSDSERDRLRLWLREGGVVIATRGAAGWARRELAGVRPDSEDEEERPPTPKLPERVPYAGYGERAAEERIAGTIFEAWIDRTHPIAYGFHRDRVSLFRNSTQLLPLDANNPFADLVQYTDEPLIAGYAADEKVGEIAGTAAVSAHRVGTGLVVQIADDPCFRGIWHGTSRFVANALFFSGAVSSTRRLGASEEAPEVDSHGHAHTDFGDPDHRP